MRVIMLAAAIGLATALPATAQDTGSAPAPAATPVPEKKVCRRYDVTGSILPAKRVCRTKQEWQAIDSNNAGTTQSMRDHAGRGTSPND
ncbi:MAG: hypothetical protein WDN44_00010 [Sphingomonas sp.]